MLQPEGHQPPPREQQADRHRRAGPPQRAGPGHLDRRAVAAPDVQRRVGDPPARGQQFDHRQDDCAAQGVHAGDDVREDAAGEHDRRPAAVPPLPDGAGEEPEEQHGQRQAEGVGVLPRQRREQVPAVDGERVVEQERQRGGGQEGGERGPQPEEPAAGPGADGQHDRTEDRAQLERDAVGDDPAADGDEEVGDREVEGVEREAVVPARVPTREVAVAEQASRGTWASRCARPCRRRWSSCSSAACSGCSCDSVTTMTLAMVITVMAPGTHHQLPRGRRVEPPPAAGRGSGAATAPVTASGPTTSATCNRMRAGAVEGSPSNHGRSATSGLRYRPDPAPEGSGRRLANGHPARMALGQEGRAPRAAAISARPPRAVSAERARRPGSGRPGAPDER